MSFQHRSVHMRKYNNCSPKLDFDYFRRWVYYFTTKFSVDIFLSWWLIGNIIEYEKFFFVLCLDDELIFLAIRGVNTVAKGIV